MPCAFMSSIDTYSCTFKHRIAPTRPIRPVLVVLATAAAAAAVVELLKIRERVAHSMMLRCVVFVFFLLQEEQKCYGND